MKNHIQGVIAAIITPVNLNGEVDLTRLVGIAEHLLQNGCSALNLLGTTGEATSLSVAQRSAVMQHVADAGLPLDRFMVGTGASATADAVHLTQLAARLGFAGALVLPPFYYKNVTEEGVMNYFDSIVRATYAPSIPIYLYNFPALSGVAFTTNLTNRLLENFGDRIAGLKDSSGDLPYAREIAGLKKDFRVFPSNEAILMEARKGQFSGCISATANITAQHCAAAYNDGDEVALESAVRVRNLFAGIPLVPSIKALMGELFCDQQLVNTLPPLAPISQAEIQELLSRYNDVHSN
jgi:4-hydroxy-tetrahydrodipicolinate synthase